MLGPEWEGMWAQMSETVSPLAKVGSESVWDRVSDSVLEIVSANLDETEPVSVHPDVWGIVWVQEFPSHGNVARLWATPPFWILWDGFRAGISGCTCRFSPWPNK
jgi:hypothetical protein